VTDEERQGLARVAMRDYCPSTVGGSHPTWIGELAALGPVSFHVHDSLMHAGLIVWSDGWRLTAAGWAALEAADPQPEPEQCADCGEVIVGAHGHCPGVPGGFGND
jgi:hypothetical protein